MDSDIFHDHNLNVESEIQMEGILEWLLVKLNKAGRVIEKSNYVDSWCQFYEILVHVHE